MKKEYLIYIFNYIYEYVELFEKYTDKYIEELIKDLDKLEKNVNNQLNNIYNTFYENLNKNISSFVSYQYITQLNENKTKCQKYSMSKLEEYQKEDEINYERYINYTLENSDYNSNNEENCFFNKTNFLLICVNNSFYNYSAYIVEEFDLFYKEKLYFH